MTSPDKQDQNQPLPENEVPEAPPPENSAPLPPPPFGPGELPPGPPPVDQPSNTPPPPQHSASGQLPPPPVASGQGGDFKPPVPYSGSPYTAAPPRRPSDCQLIAILSIIGGAVSILAGIGVATITACCYPIYLVQIPTGIWGVIHGVRMLSAEEAAPSEVLAIFYMICLLGCDPITFSIGLIMYLTMKKPEVKNYYLAQGKAY